MFKKIKEIFSIKTPNHKDYSFPHEILYRKILQTSYNNWFYKDLKVDDTIEGRFEIIVLHIFVLFKILDERNEENTIFKQKLLETFIEELDSTYREIGISDNTFAKKMKIAVQSIYGRIDSYNNQFDNIDLFSESLQRNIWPLEKGKIKESKLLSNYVYDKIKKYKNKEYKDIIQRPSDEF